MAKGSLPIAGFYLAEVVMTLTDAAFVGHIGSAQLAAVGLSMGALFPLIFGAIAFVTTGGVFVSEAHARTDDGQARDAVDLSLWACLLLSPVLMFGASTLPWLFKLTGQDTTVVALSSTYLGIVLWSIPAILGFSVLRTYVAALDRNRIVVVASLTGVVLNVVLNHALVHGRWGAPALGPAGSALSTVTSAAAMLLLIAGYCHRRLGYRFSVVSVMALRREQVRDLLRVGGPAFATGLFESSLFGVVMVLAGQFGVEFLAATTIAIYVSDVFIVIALGLGDRLTVEVASRAALDDVVACRQLAWAGILLTTLAGLPLATLCVFFPEALIRLFVDDTSADAATVTATAKDLLAVLAVFLFADSYQVVLSRTLKGLRDTLIPMWIAATGFWIVGIGGGWWLAVATGLGGIGLWYGLAAGLSLAAIVMAARLHRCCRQLAGRSTGKKSPAAE